MKHFRQHNQRPRKNSLIFGREKLLEAILAGEQIDRIYVDSRSNDKTIGQIRTLASTHHIPVNSVPVAKLNSFNVKDHEGCVAVKSRIQYHSLQELISFVVEKGDSPLFLILDGITDIRNIGGIARTAYCCGVHGLIIPDKGVGALNEDAILTSAGALEKIPVSRVNSLMKAVDELHLNGIKVFASDMKASKSLAECNFIEPCAIIMGSEEKGIFPALMKISDERFKIPMQKDFESFNVSVAAGIILYEAMRQRNN